MSLHSQQQYNWESSYRTSPVIEDRPCPRSLRHIFPLISHQHAQLLEANVSFCRSITNSSPAPCSSDISHNLHSCEYNSDSYCNYRERKIRRNMLTTNRMQGQVRCCQIWGRRRKREENHMSGS